jgi:hypothetical protein
MLDNNWNGEGVPEVGQFIQSNINGGKPVEVVSTGVSQVCTITNSGFLCVYNIVDCLPTPNAKQVARDKSIDEMFDIVKERGNGTTVEMLYHAGYRKVKPLNQHDLIAWFRGGVKDISLFNYLIKNGYCIGEE